MTREQIEAWLALEGWEPMKKLGYIPMYRRDRCIVYVPIYGEGAYIRKIDSWEHEEDDPDLPQFSLKQLQLIYQEIIKHEKD